VSDDKNIDQDAKTVMMSGDEIAELATAAEEDAADGDADGGDAPVVNVAVKPTGKARERGGRSQAFSETQWFMKGKEIDADMLETVEEEEYDRDEKISEKDRKGFTLRDTE
jgi:hypothetical protein